MSFLIRETKAKASGIVPKSSQTIFSQLSTSSLDGQMADEGTSVLTKVEKTSRAAAYKNRSEEECKTLKLQFDATLQKRVTRCCLIKLMPSNIQRIWLLRMLKDTRTTYNLALGHLLKNNVHKKSAADLNMTLLESELQKMFATKQGVLGNATTSSCVHQRSLVSKLSRQSSLYSRHIIPERRNDSCSMPGIQTP